MEISTCVKYVGVNDHQVDLFEGQYKVPNGMSYNSYVILDDKIAVMDTVDANFTHECRTGTFRKNTGLSCDSTYGAGSFRQHSRFLKKISQNHSGIHSEGIPVHGTVFPGIFRQTGITCGTTHRCGE